MFTNSRRKQVSPMSRMVAAGMLLIAVLAGATCPAQSDRIEQLNRRIREHNLLWTAGETALGQLDDHQRRQLAGGWPTPASQVDPARVWNPAAEGLSPRLYPAAYDLRDLGVIPPVKNQGTCGSCWAFSAVANLEALHLKAGMDFQSLSEQTVLNCSDGTCSGWYLNTTFDYLQGSGVPSETTVPYVGTKQACSSYARIGQILSWEWINPSGTASDYYDDLIKTYIYTWQKPVSCRMEVYDSFYDYANGIYEHIPGETNWGGHFVLIVGWGSSAGVDFWICKNSWGTWWGQSGFFFIRKQDSVIGTWAIGAEARTAATTDAMVWFNDSAGAMSAWTLNKSTGALFDSFGYTIAGWTCNAFHRTLDGTGALLWSNAASGSASVWTVNTLTGGHASAFGYTVPGWTAAHYRPDGTGKGHLLWTRNTGGAVSIWTVNASTGAYQGAIGFEVPGWTARSYQSCPDGHGQLLWTQDASGSASIWTVDATTGAYVGNLGYTVAGWRAVEFSRNNDGTGNLVWVNTASGAVSVWTLQLSTGSVTGSRGYSAGAWRCACFDRWVNPGGTARRPPDLPWQ